MYLLASGPETEHQVRTWSVAVGTTVVLAGGMLLGVMQIEPSPVKPRPAIIAMRVIHTPPPVAIPEPSMAPHLPAKVARKKRVKSTSTRRLKAPAPPKATPEPEPQPMPQATSDPPPSKAVPLVVGLTLSSTSAKGRGPRLAVGNTLMGAPSQVATTPVSGPMVGGAVQASSGTTATAGSSGSQKVRVAAQLQHSTPPFYPPAAKRDGLEGVVVLTITISAEGTVKQARVIRGLSRPLDASALTAAKQTLWTPATVDGRPVTITRRFNVRFTLQS